MLCENCGENEANVSYTQIINGVKKELHLCEECANSLGISSMNFEMPSFNIPTFDMPISLSSFLGDFFEDEKEVLPTFKTEEIKCNKCGMTYEEFIDTGKFGCDECYKTLSKKIDPILKNIHGGTTHIGRKLNINRKNNIVNENNDNNNQQNVVELETKSSESQELNKLKTQLKIAIQEERYEDAAKIRDEIKKFEK